MTAKDRLELVRFTLRTAMYIGVDDKSGITGFLHGYDMGRNGKCLFLDLLSENLEKIYGIEPRNYGWCGQIQLYADRYGLEWNTAFKQIALEVLLDETLPYNPKIQNNIRLRIRSVVNRIENPYWFDNRWKQEWITFCPTHKEWFKKLWTEDEYTSLKQMDDYVSQNEIGVSEGGKTKPTPTLIDFKKQLEKKWTSPVEPR